ncbi:HAD family hydrolase [Paenibacillus sp. N3.4]|uniref:HAD family hydrolase n=1 Tax=Paenibacillus sp. N3.4 TaxID=2603222 RepID=UPI0011CC00BA|nr:HAD family hydrolase [Paenibacillus sp. N3.4]TXK85436.1 HAD family hydrolase [Paenibacillus sp. N3.4]
MDLRQITWIFFDVGDTLVDETKPMNSTFEQFVHYASELGYSLDTQTVRESFMTAYRTYQDRPMQYVTETLVSKEEDRALIRSKMKYEKQLEEPFPDAERVLERIAERYKIGIIANQSVGTTARLETYGLMKHISMVCASAEAGLSKPDVKFYELALHEAGCRPEEAVMVGDRLDNDIVPAQFLGMGTIWVRQGLAREQPVPYAGVTPDAIIDQLADIVHVLLKDFT